MAVVGLLAAVFDATTFPREDLTVVFLIAYAVQMFLFAQWARLGATSRGRNRGHGEGPAGAAAPPEAFAPPVTQEVGQLADQEGAQG